MKISLVIPVRNEEHSLDELCRSILGQSRMPDEVIFVDGGSDDRSCDIVKDYSSKNPKIRLLSIGPAYPGTARNAGVKISSGEAIAFTDAGIKLDMDWLRYLAEPMEDGSADVVYGNYEPVTDSFFKECLAIVFIPAPRVTPGGKVRSHFIASSIMRRSVWEAIGGFTGFRAAEDRIFMEAVDSHGFRVSFAPSAMVFWDIPGDFKAAFRRFSLYSMHDLRAGRFKDWHRPVVAMYILGLLLILLGTFHSPAWFIVLFMGVLARAINLISARSNMAPLLKRFAVRRILLVTALILWTDVAMFVGMARYMAGLLINKR